MCSSDLAVTLLVARRPDRRTILLGVVVLALAFFVLPTRVHERYLFPLVGLGAILAAVSRRWLAAYVVASAAMFVNMYVVLVVLYPNNPGVVDWLDLGATLKSTPVVTSVALSLLAVLVFAFLQFRPRALATLAEEIADAAESGPVAPAPVAPDRKSTRLNSSHT